MGGNTHVHDLAWDMIKTVKKLLTGCRRSVGLRSECRNG